MEKLKLEIQGEEIKRTYKEVTMKVRPNIYEMIKEVSDRTGMSRIDIAGLLIEFAYDNVEYIEEKQK